MTELLVLCTGNAARSVMAGFMLDVLREGRPGDPLHVVTAGTHTIDGQPMSLRTRTALTRLPELAGADFRRHRSRQVHGVDLVHAELVVVMEADHVRFVRRQFPDAAAKTATIRHLCQRLAPPPPDSVGAGGGPGPRDGRARRQRGRARPGRARGGRLCRVRRRAVGVVPEARHAAVTRDAPTPDAVVAQSAWTDRSPAQARSAMRPASFCASSSTSAAESGRCAMKRRLAPFAMPTMP